MGHTAEPGSSEGGAPAKSTITDHRVAGGPPRFFALTVTPDGALLAGTCGRGASRSADGGRVWVPISGPGNAVVHDFAMAPDGSILASTGGSGLHRSLDDGRTWRAAGLDGQIVYGLDAGPELLVGTHGSGVARSTDGGATWTVDDGSPAVTVYRVLNIGEAGTLAATDGRGIWASTGEDWRPVGLDGLVVYGLVRLDRGLVLAGTRGRGLHRSLDDGASWEEVHPDVPDPDIHTLVAHRGAVLAGTGHGVHRSRDRGETWQPVGVELGSRRIFSLAASGAEIWAGSYDGVWRWPGAEKSWEAVDTGLSPCEAFTLGLGADGSLLAGTKTGALRSTDGGRCWQRIPGLGSIAVHAVLGVSTGDLLVGTDNGVRSSDDPTDLESARWSAAGLESTWVFALVEAEDRVLAGTLGQGTFARTGPRSWEPSRHGLPHPNVHDLCLTRDGAVLAATGVRAKGGKSGGIFRSTDGGRSWMPTAHGPITVYRIVEDSAGRLFAGAQRCHVLISDDGGSTWDTVAPPVHDLKMYCLASDREDRLYLAAGALLLRSDDGAATWTVVGDGLDGVTTYDLVEHEGALIIATSSGMFRSEDRGDTWRPVGDG